MMMRKAAIVLVILIIALSGALVLGPRFVDLDRYRPEISAKASAVLGRPVTLAGPISLSLLPNPHVTIADVHIANLSGGSTPEMAQVRAIEATASLWPLLAGHIEVTSARLVQPRILLERLPDGRANWNFAPQVATGSTSAPGPGVTGTAAPNADRSGVQITHLAVEDGTLSFAGGGSAELFEHINLILAGDAVAGPMHAEGSITSRGVALTVATDVGRLAQPRVTVSARIAAASAVTLALQGEWVQAPSQYSFQGNFTITSTDPRAAAALAGIASPQPILAKSLRASGDVVASFDAVTLDHLSFDLDDLHGTGTIHATSGTTRTVDLKFAVSNIDLDRLLSDSGGAATSASSAPRTGATTPLPQGAVEPAAAAVKIPANIDVSLDLGIEALQWHGGIIRQARLKAVLASGKVTVKEFDALLPGGSGVAVTGIVDTASGKPRFSGSVKANSDNLRDFLRWIGITIEQVPADRLRRVAFAGTLDAEQNSIDLHTLDLMLDAVHVTGAATVALRDRLAFGTRLEVEQLNLDAYLSGDKAAPKAGAAAAPAASAAASEGLVAPAVAGALASLDANFDVAVEALTWQGQPIRKMHLVGTLLNGDLTVRELSVGDLGGAVGKASGYLQRPGSTAEKAELVFDMRGPELSRVMRLIAPTIASADTFGVFSLGGEAKREGQRISLDMDVEAAGGKLHVSGNSSKSEVWDLAVALDHPSYNRLMRLASPTYRPQGGELGPVKLHGNLEWKPQSVTTSGLDLEIGGMTVTGDARVTLEGRPKLSATLALGDVAVDRFLPIRQSASLEPPMRGSLKPGVMLAEARTGSTAGGDTHWSHTPIDLSFLKLFDADVALSGKSLTWAQWRLDRPQANLNLKDAILDMPKLAGGLFGGDLSANANVNAAGTSSMTLKASLAGANLKQALAEAGVTLVEGNFDVQTSLAATGASPFDLVSHLNGDATLKGRDGTINGINLPALNQRLNQIHGPGDLLAVLQAGRGGSTHFSSLDGTFKVTNGVAVSNDLHLIADGGEGNGRATVDFPQWTIASRTDFRLTGAQDSPPMGIIVEGPLDQPSRVFDIKAIEQYLVGRAVNRMLQPQAPQGQSGATQPQNPQAPQSPQNPPNPQDILRNILKVPR